MLIIEIKTYSPNSGMDIVHYLELEAEGSGDIANYQARHYEQAGAQRTLLSSRQIKAQPRQHGALALVRRALNEFSAEQVKQLKEVA